MTDMIGVQTVYDGHDKRTDRECMTDMIREQIMDDGYGKSTDEEWMTDKEWMTYIKEYS